MPKSHDPPGAIQNCLAEIRAKRGLGAAELASRVGVSRQTVYAMEAGDYVPNTLVALRLAQALEVAVEELFRLEPETPLHAKTEEAELLASEPLPQPGQPMQLCRVGKRTIAIPATPAPLYLPPADGVLIKQGKRDGKASIQLLLDEIPEQRLLMAGCDPAMSVLARHVQKSDTELVLASCNSSRALELLKSGQCHIAGTHLKDAPSGESNLPAIYQRFPKTAVSVITFAIWEEGLVVAAGNPFEIQTVADLTRPSLRFLNRELGAGSRQLLDTERERLGIPADQIDGYDRTASGHLAAAWQVHSGQADCCIATRSAARVFGLDFVPMVTERYDLVIRKEHMSLTGLQHLLDTLNRSAFRRELETLGGYNTATTGKLMA